MDFESLYSILNNVLKDKVFYGSNVYDNDDNASMPYIVYQEISKRPFGYSDDKPLGYTRSVQITLVTKTKDLQLEQRLEEELIRNNIYFTALTESHNSDRSVNRIYEIQMED